MTDAAPMRHARRPALRPVPVWAWALIGVVLAVLVGIAAYLASGAIANVPDVVGRPSDEALLALEAAGFTRGRVTRVETSAPVGQVLAQDPAAGSIGSRGDDVALTVAAPVTTAVPALRGLEARAARSAAVAAGLTLSVHASYDASATSGTVIAQVPAARSKVARGAVVAVLVSRGPQPPAARIPDVRGAARDAAVARIAKAGFEPVVHEGAVAASGTVAAQLPARGTLATAGSRVHLLVASGQVTATVEVPNVVNLARKDAVDALAAAGFVTSVEQAPSAVVATGTVIAQLPAAASRAADGTDAILVVSRGTGTGELPAPDVEGRNSAAAQAVLEPLGLTFTSVASVSLDVPAGDVIAQLPLPGSPIRPGDAVICIVSSGRPR